MVVETLAKQSKAKSRKEGSSTAIIQEPPATDESSPKKRKKSKSGDRLKDANAPPLEDTDVPSVEQPKKKRKREHVAQIQQMDVDSEDRKMEGTTPSAPIEKSAGADDKPKKKKRKHAEKEEITNVESATPAEEPRKRKKRKSDAQNDAVEGDAPKASTSQPDEDTAEKPYKKYPHPAKDESLSEHASKALSYAYTFHKHHEVWKFNKGQQNWLLRNCWSTREIPDQYIPLLKKYMKTLQGGARERLLETCKSILETPEAPEKKEQAVAESTEPAAEETTEKSVRFAEKTDVAPAESAAQPESKVKRAKAFAKVLSSADS
ncbi:hypothetical protein BD626DRAFT_481427 [Schizophyllum amplum]|uniref:WKF domain-containing protein n=1 Tax=Schizophyllum amplum TaxID=97359 RepID=A0A550CU73_9AGAR|nr:hypothetical protein BD626DRAFT_481427 [Auriculariopsis ampla]